MTEMDELGSVPTNTQDHNAALNRTLDLLKAHDDTSRFVGLALLKSLLDNHEDLRNDPEAVTKCWAAVPMRFLERLLKAPKSKEKSTEETTSMVDLAVSVMYTFTLLMPSTALEDDKLIDMLDELVHVLRYSSPEAQLQILRILLSLAGGVKGARSLLRIPDLSALFKIAPSQPLALEVLRYAILNAIARPELTESKVDDIISGLVECFKEVDAKPLLEFLADLLPKIPLSDVRVEPPWLQPLADMIRTNITSRLPTFQKIGTSLASTLLQAFPLAFPRLLFMNVPVSKAAETKPFLYFFVNLISIDLRSTFPSLLELLASPEYPDISQQLTADFNVLSAFVGFLAAIFDHEDNQSTLPLSPDLLLKLRRDLGETASLTIEFLRDRWDGAVSGAAGLHPSVRPSPGTPAPNNAPLALPWDDKNGGVVKDPLTLAAVQYLALWLREDDGETLRREAAGILDVLLGLYNVHEDAEDRKPHDLPDFRSPILLSLQGILATDDGIAAFFREDGLASLSKDLATIIMQISMANGGSAATELIRAMQIVDVLYTVQEHETERGVREEWMALVKIAASLPFSNKHEPDMQLDFRVSLYQLATTLLTRAPVGIRSRFTTEATAIADSCRSLVEVYGSSSLSADNVDAAREVLGSLDRLGINGSR